MNSKARVSLVLLVYFLIAGSILALPVILFFLKDVPHRFEILACFYVLLFFYFLIRNFLLGGGVHVGLTSQVNAVYGDSLQTSKHRLIDLHCMSLLRIADVWLVFPSDCLSRIVRKNELFQLYELTLEQWPAILSAQKK